jgi:hypothetical protein
MRICASGSCECVYAWCLTSYTISSTVCVVRMCCVFVCACMSVCVLSGTQLK